MPLTPSIIEQVHKIPEMKNMLKRLKIRNRSNQFLFNSAWIARVDYDEDQFNDEEDEKFKRICDGLECNKCQQIVKKIQNRKKEQL